MASCSNQCFSCSRDRCAYWEDKIIMDGLNRVIWPLLVGLVGVPSTTDPEANEKEYPDRYFKKWTDGDKTYHCRQISKYGMPCPTPDSGCENCTQKPMDGFRGWYE